MSSTDISDAESDLQDQHQQQQPQPPPQQQGEKKDKPSLTVQQIIEAIPGLLRYVKEVKKSIEDNKDKIINSSTAAAVNGGDSSNVNGSDSGSGGKEKDISENGICFNLGFGKRSKDEKIDDNNGSSTQSGPDTAEKLSSQVEQLERDLNSVKDALDKLDSFEKSLSDQFQNLQKGGTDLNSVVAKLPSISNFPVQQIHSKIRLLSEIVLKLKIQIPSSHKLFKNSDAHREDTANESAAYSTIDGLPILHQDDKIKSTVFFKDLNKIYDELNPQYKLCVLYFAVFPENVIIKKRLMVNWWIGEGLLDPPDAGQTAEKTGDGILKFFAGKNLIEPVIKKRNILMGYRMHSLIRSSLIILAKEAGFFDFDDKGIPTAKFSWSCRACLVKTEQQYSRNDLFSTKLNLDQENLITIFNINDPYPDFKFEWFQKMKNANVLHLGGWQSSSKHHIEVEDTDFLKGLKNMKHLKLFSLQGISRITVLPESVCMLSNLRILDLHKCHNLESLPEKIDSLKKLTHLDISECYLLDHMPRKLASLLELQVLKGFIVSDMKKSKNACPFSDLVALKKLRKLSITTSKISFPDENDITALKRFEALQKLTIAWAGKSLEKSDRSPPKKENPLMEENTPKKENISKEENALKKENPTETRLVRRPLPRSNAFKRKGDNSTKVMKLEKLDLQCYLGIEVPSWLKPGELRMLRKLYIRGGNLQDLGLGVVENAEKWDVETLRLKFLNELVVDWKDLQESFPKLIYLEKVKCRKLCFFPCDQSGVWQKSDKKQT